MIQINPTNFERPDWDYPEYEHYFDDDPFEDESTDDFYTEPCEWDLFDDDELMEEVMLDDDPDE